MAEVVQLLPRAREAAITDSSRRPMTAAAIHLACSDVTGRRIVARWLHLGYRFRWVVDEHSHRR